MSDANSNILTMCELDYDSFVCSFSLPFGMPCNFYCKSNMFHQVIGTKVNMCFTLGFILMSQGFRLYLRFAVASRARNLLFPSVYFLCPILI